MNRTLLYYPTIDIPNRNWLRHALLYWDEVSSIVPKSWDDRILVNLSPDIRYLLNEGQFRPIKPEDLISKGENWAAFQEFQQEFIEIVSSPGFKRLLHRGNQNSVFRIHANKVENNTPIHSNKTSDSLFYFLEEQGLATRGDNDEWINFERNTALLYMSLLAKYLADIDSQYTTVGTDNTSYERFNFQRVSEKKGFPVVSFNLNRVLPTPKENVPFEKIVDFKRKREDNLRHFKQILSDFQARIASSSSKGEVKEHTINFQETLINGVGDLDKVLKDAAIDHSLKSFRSLINLKSPTTLAALGSLVNNRIDLFDLPLNLNAIGLAAMGAIELTANYIDVKNKQRAKLRESPFSYVYSAYRHGIIKRPGKIGGS